MPANEYYDSTGAPSSGSDVNSSPMRAEFDLIEAGFNKMPTMSGNGNKPIFVNAGGSALIPKTAAEAMVLLGGEYSSNKDASGGYVGLTLLKINFKNVLGTITSFFTNSNTAARTYTFPDKDGTVAMMSDVPDTSNLVPKTTTVNGYPLSSNVTIAKADVGLGNCDNTSDLNKPISTLTQAELDLKASQAAVDLKAPLASPALTGNPTVPTQVAGDSSTKAASTAFVANAVSTGARKTMILEDSKAQNTHGGSSVSGSYTVRTFNSTPVLNQITGASTTGTQHTLPAGTFIIEASAPGLGCGVHQAYLYNVTAAAEIRRGSSEISASGGEYAQSRSFVTAYFILAAPAVIELRHYTASAYATYGLGRASNNGTEIYSKMRIEQIA